MLSQVIMCRDVGHGLTSLIQTAGLGALAPNTAMLAWPKHWKDDRAKAVRMCLLLQRVQAYNMATIVVSGSSNIPEHHVRVHAPMDIWWVVHDGGLQLLLTTILRKNRVWHSCPLRVFCVLQQGEDPDELQKSVEGFVYSMRIDAEVKCVVLKDDNNSMKQSATPKYGRQARAADWEVNSAIVNQPIGNMMRGTAVADGMVEDQRAARRSMGAATPRSDAVPTTSSITNVINIETGTLLDPERDSKQERRKSLSGNSEAQQTLRSTRVLNRLFCKYSQESSLVMTNLPPPVLHDDYTPMLYMEQVSKLVEDLPLCLLVAGQRNKNVVTMYS